MDKEVSMIFNNEIKNQDKLKEYEKQLKNIRSLLAGFNNENIEKVTEAASELKNMDKNLEQQSQIVKAAFSYTAVREFTRGLQRTFQELSRLTTKSADFLENLNLYQVAFDGNYKSADRFINKMTEMYGLDESWLTRTVGIFKQLSNAMNLSAETGERLSTLLTQMTLDLSSLYNIDMDKTASILQSALAGQTKPIRGATGGDITVPTLQTALDNLGIERAANQLSFAEKRLLIIVSLTQQLNASIGDMGRTIEQPANQMRVLSMQWERLSRALGDLFLPILAKILPYLNAILMVLTEIISTIAKFVSSLLGFKQQDFKGTLYGVSDGALSLSGNLDKASNSAKKLKQGLRGFDKLNVVTTPASGGGSAGGGGAGGISPEMLGAFNKSFDEYNKKLKNVEMQATKIRDKIMEWLGFTKLIDEKTDDVSFKFDHITSGTVLGALAVGGTIYTGVRKILDIMRKIGLIDFKIPSLAKILKSFLKTKTGLVTLITIEVGLEFHSLLEQWNKFKESIEKGNVWDFFDIDSINDLAEKIWVLTTTILTGPIPLLLTGIYTFRDKIFEVISSIWGKINKNIISPLVKFVNEIARFIYDNAIKPTIDFFKPIIDAVSEIIEHILSKIWEIVSGVAKAVATILEKIWEIFKKIVEILAALWNYAYDYLIKPTLNYIAELFAKFYNGFIKPMLNIFKNVGSWVYNNVIKSIWEKIVWLKDKAVSIFKTIGTYVVDFVSGSFKAVINGVLSGIESAINKFIKMLNKAIKVINKIPGVEITKLDLISVPKLDVGGMPPVGQLFIANERGPELVGHIGGQSFVANQNQMMDLLDKKISNPKSSNANQIFNIYLDENHKIGTYTLEQLQGMAKTNGKPITIS